MRVPDEVKQAWLASGADHSVYGTPEERVERGVAWLEEVVGEDWADKVKLVDFTFDDPCRCVLGFTIDEETFEAKANRPARWLSGYTLGLDLALALHQFDDDLDRYLWGDYHGFDGAPMYELSTLWRQRIEAEQDRG